MDSRVQIIPGFHWNIDGENPVSVHVVNIQVDRAERQVSAGESLHEVSHFLFGLVAPTCLVEAQRQSIHKKAKAMGYRVQETRQGDKLRLVLVKRVY